MENSVGIRQLKQNASAVIARVKKGEALIVTDRGIPVARITPASTGNWEDMVAGGQVVDPTRDAAGVFEGILGELPTTSLSATLETLREER